MTQTTRGAQRLASRRVSRFWVEALETRLVLSTYVVNSLLDTSGNDRASLTLRDAILQSNASADPATNQIQFQVGSGLQTISLNSALPAITHAVVINGLTQPGSNGQPVILLTPNANKPFSGDGLTSYAAGTTIRGLVLAGFAGNGIVIGRNGGDLVENCVIGTDGTIGAGNMGDGILIKAVPNNVVRNNVIAGNEAGSGVFISSDGRTPPLTIVTTTQTSDMIAGTATVQASQAPNGSGPQVQGTFTLNNGNPAFSFAPTDGSVQATTTQIVNRSFLLAGTSTFPATGSLTAGSLGEEVTSTQTTSPVTGDITLGNLTLTIPIDASFSGADITGNYSFRGTLFAPGIFGQSKGPVPGKISGTLTTSSQQTKVETTVPVPNNPTGNLIDSNLIGTNRAGTAKLGNLVGVKIEGIAANANIVRGNQIRFDSTDGVLLQNGASSNRVESNRVSENLAIGVHLIGGVDNTINGNTVDANGGDGVRVSGGSGNIITNNMVTKSQSVGIQIRDGSALNTIQGNAILTSTQEGLFLNGSFGNHVVGNTIGGSGSGGVHIFADPGAAALTSSPNLVESNMIGTDAANSTTPANFIGVDLDGSGPGSSVLRANQIRFSTSDGIYIHNGSSNNRVEAGNVVSNNATVGVQIFGGNGNVIASATIESNGLDGIFINAGSNNQVSGSTVAQNHGVGIQIFGPATDNIIQGNTITNSGTDGVFVNSAMANHIIANTISNNTNVGIHLFGKTSAARSTKNQVVGNTIHGNLDGIALDGWASQNQIGGVSTQPGLSPGNTVSGNRRSGINLVGGNANLNTIQGNLLQNNHRLDFVLQSAASGNVVGGPLSAANSLSTPLALYSGARSRNRIGKNTVASSSSVVTRTPKVHVPPRSR